MLHHTEAQHFLPIINIILGQVDVLLKQDELDEKQLSILISILATILTVRKAKRVQGMLRWGFIIGTCLTFDIRLQAYY